MFNCFIRECDWGVQTFPCHYNQDINLSLAETSKENRVEICWLKLILSHHISSSIWIFDGLLEKVKMKIIQSMRTIPCTVFIPYTSFSKYSLSTHPCACPMLGSWYRGVVQMSITGKQTLRRRLDLWQAKRLDLLIHWPVTECSSPWEGGVTLGKGASSSLEAGWARPSVLEGDPMSTESIQSLPSENVSIISQHILYTSFLVLLIWIYNSF